ncbi:Sensor histidine kinase [human gut metagenome]|jgi:hypothetical protein|uniref:Sensor histidine kinase n=1 Tax=human gut metagenome TaxID=408170 RepID=W1WX54_9ZZZZ|nr:hypothetical protein HMPREF0794_2404 [Staphylococcus epidermidis M23864:W2(grey)]
MVMIDNANKNCSCVMLYQAVQSLNNYTIMASKIIRNLYIILSIKFVSVIKIWLNMELSFE